MIDKEILNRNFWFEDIDGNIINREQAEVIDGVTYHRLSPLEITEHLYSYCWTPKTLIQKHLCLIKPVRKYLERKHFEEKTFNPICNSSCNIGNSNSDVILAMVNSGDFTLSEALYLYSQCCERCMNILAYKYLNGKEGYEKYSEEWEKCNTNCEFCDKI